VFLIGVGINVGEFNLRPGRSQAKYYFWCVAPTEITRK
jgi:hypothetical protein